jgi:hypothetical protein
VKTTVNENENRKSINLRKYCLLIKNKDIIKNKIK